MRVRTDDAEASADAAVVAVPASVIGTIKFDPPLGDAQGQRTPVGALRAGGEAVRPAARRRRPRARRCRCPGRWWCYTQLGADGEPLPFVAAFAGSPRAIEALDLGNGPGRWLDVVDGTATRPRPRTRRGDDLDLGPGPVGPGRVLGTLGVGVDRGPGAQPPVGRLAFAGEHTAGRWHGLMEGALRSGGAPRGSCRRCRRLVHDQHVAVRLVRHRLADALTEYARDQVRLARADDDQIGTAVLCELHDRVGRIADAGRNSAATPCASRYSCASLELLGVLRRRVGRVDRPG